MYVEDAMELLRERVARAPRGTEKIVVIHGYNRGGRPERGRPQVPRPTGCGSRPVIPERGRNRDMAEKLTTKSTCKKKREWLQRLKK